VDALSYKTKYVNQATAQKEWLLVDAENEVAGRLASKVAYLLRGKHKTSFTPYVDNGTSIVIINADKIRFTGKKMTDKEYIRYTGYPGGQRFATPKELLSRKPAEILYHAIHGMLPKNRLGRRLNTNVFIYAGTEHIHEAQQPKKIDLSTVKA
jgi:large subunit ribosomal protein L13